MEVLGVFLLLGKSKEDEKERRREREYGKQGPAAPFFIPHSVFFFFSFFKMGHG